jgi:hypothetical protein
VRKCPNCGKKVTGHKNQKWCSEKCRKSQYLGMCEDCGGTTAGRSGGWRKAPRRCNACANQHAGTRSQRSYMNYGGKAPAPAKPCRCETPMIDGDSCFKCGSPVRTEGVP